MYHQYFGLRELPFSLTPDTQYFFAYGHYGDALNTLLVALRTGEGFIKVTGEVGTGKTLLCRKLLNSLDDRFVTLYIPNPMLTPSGLQTAVADELEIPITRYAHRLNKLITQRLIELSAAGKQIVLCLDEVQAMPQETLEALRLLTNLETEKTKLLQVVMFGQPELDEHLARPSIRQLKQRITFSYKLKPLDARGLEAYVSHRLVVAGHAGGSLFSGEALEYVHRVSGGIPRLINIICHKSLMTAYGKGNKTVAVSHVRSAAKDTETQKPARVRHMRWHWLALGLTAILAAASNAALLLAY